MDWARAIEINRQALSRIVAELLPSRPARKTARRPVRKPGGRMSFQLFDPRRGFARVRRSPASKAMPRIRVLAHDPRIAMLHALPPPPAMTPAPEPDGAVSARRVLCRLSAIKAALEDLPGQAKRLARWRARREQMAFTRFQSPLRPGRPPGFRSRPRHEVDHALAECHRLAYAVTRGDTS